MEIRDPSCRRGQCGARHAPAPPLRSRRPDGQGGPGPDAWAGTADADSCGSEGDDVVSGAAGDDRLAGNLGNHSVDGGGGHDEIFGLEGGDTLHGNAGNDALFGGEGDDELHGSDGNDVLRVDADETYTTPGAWDVLTGGAGDDLDDLGEVEGPGPSF